LDTDAGGFTTAKAQAIVAQPNLNGIAQRRDGDDLDFLALSQPHFEQALHQGIVSLQCFDPAALTDNKLIEVHGGFR
jgi:hypothetical protein